MEEDNFEGDRFSEVTNESWFSRIGGAIKGIFIGLLLVLISFPLLFWNEGRAVKRHKTLNEGAGRVISILCEQVDAANDGALVHLSGVATTEEILNDPVFNVSENALKLVRRVEMYQWDEDKSSTKKKKVGGGTEKRTTFSYKKVWASRVIDATNFKTPSGHANPDKMPWQSSEFVAESITLGAFRLPHSLISKIDGLTPVQLPASDPLPELPSIDVQRMATGYYLGRDINSPEIGDMRVSFKVINPAHVSVVARQTSDSLEPYQGSQGGTIELLSMGSVSSDAMFQQAKQTSVIITWLIRLGGFVLMFIGLGMFFGLFSVLADIVPIFGTIVGAGTHFIAFLMAGAFASITIAIAWVVYRPLIGISLLVAAIAFGVLVFKKIR